MDTTTQRDLARTFRAYHLGGGGPFVLANAWDAASALVYEATGFEAVGTSSAGIAASLGVPDGEHLSRSEMLTAVERIAHSVDLPVSADIEAGYGDSPAAVAETVRRTVEAGAVGVNVEDWRDGGLVALADQVETLRAAREAADGTGVPLVLNGRTDVFWRAVGDETSRVERAVERGNAYLDAGSDCVFVPGVSDPEAIAALVDGLDGPLNVLAGPGSPAVPALADLGVDRVSVGSGPMRATLGRLRTIGTELRETGTYEGMADAIPYEELNDLLAASLDRRRG